MRWLRVSVLLAAALGVSCATSAAGDECGDAAGCPSGQDCVGGACVEAADAAASYDTATSYPDAGEFVDADPSDAADLAGFGEPCNDKSQCESNICIFVGIGGICTELCAGGSCPDEYGCFGVLGVIEPGVVADVCVPESTQLCTTCSDHNECSIIGQDLCLDYPDGKKFCGRDCSTVECPVGYTCDEITIGIETYDQCIPLSGACDCDASNEDATEACAIDTPFGTCAGTRTCLGAAGWGDCEPPSPTDTPDGTFTDGNCDGIDGDIDGGIFVARDSGTDSGTCGLVYTDPCATISHGLIRSAAEGRNYVYVQASGGDYTEVVAMVPGKHIFGGFDASWQRDDHTVPAHRVTIVGGYDSTASGGDNQYLTIRAHSWNLAIPTTLGDVVIEGPNAVGADASGGRSSYAVHVASANLNLERVTILGGNGAVGATGTTGLPAVTVGWTSSMDGNPGGASDEYESTCEVNSYGAGGIRGTNACGGGRDPDGGRGGDGGTMDTDCICLGICVCDNCTATNGDGGNNADYWFGALGTGGSGGSGGGSCGAPGVGQPGRIQNGAAGVASGGGGVLSGAYWYGRPGGAGGVGEHGGGGGGGGGSGGCDSGIDSYGAGGGGGGAGGCAASTGGGGGLGGGGSFGLFAHNATVTASDCVVHRGSGATGGQGGSGGHGQQGGPGGNGGTTTNDSAPGGRGGDGAHGGHGGGGGGGAGGISAGVYKYNSSVTHDCDVSLGSAGGGGAGGVSAPGATGLDDDGNDGQTGTAGTLVTDGTCTNPTGC